MRPDCSPLDDVGSGLVCLYWDGAAGHRVTVTSCLARVAELKLGGGQDQLMASIEELYPLEE